MMPRTALALLLLWYSALPLSAQEDLPQLIARIQPAVVTIIIFDGSGRVIGNGSGFFINPRGHLVSNYHVLSRAAKACWEWPWVFLAGARTSILPSPGT
jgi:S1-C subfamily serine protease